MEKGKGFEDFFGLNWKQTLIMFSIEKQLTERDILNSKDSREQKKKWLNCWEKNVINGLQKSDSGGEKDGPVTLLDRWSTREAVKEEQQAHEENTWYYLIMLEATIFIPYTSLGENKEDDKKYSKLKYKRQNEYLKALVVTDEIMKESYIDRFQKCFDDAKWRMSGGPQGIAITVLSAVAGLAIMAATFGIAAPFIAPLIAGGAFSGLSGAALVSASLAYLGGGAVAVGGAGMLGGTLVIAGGGAILGGLFGGGVGVAMSQMCATSPGLALTQMAKLEVVLKEIVLNRQKDIHRAQEVIKALKEQIISLTAEIKRLKLESQQNKKAIENLEKSLKFMENAIKEWDKFSSSFSMGFQGE